MVIGLPQMLEITTAFVYEAIKEQLNVIMDAVKSILERTPPELGVDIIRNGDLSDRRISQDQKAGSTDTGTFRHPGDRR